MSEKGAAVQELLVIIGIMARKGRLHFIGNDGRAGPTLERRVQIAQQIKW